MLQKHTFQNSKVSSNVFTDYSLVKILKKIKSHKYIFHGPIDNAPLAEASGWLNVSRTLTGAATRKKSNVENIP